MATGYDPNNNVRKFAQSTLPWDETYLNFAKKIESIFNMEDVESTSVKELLIEGQLDLISKLKDEATGPESKAFLNLADDKDVQVEALLTQMEENVKAHTDLIDATNQQMIEAFDKDPVAIERYRTNNELDSDDKAKDHFKKDLEQRKQKYLDDIKKELYYKQLAFIEAHYDEIKRLKFMALVHARRTGQDMAAFLASDATELDRKLSTQQVQYRSSPARSNALKFLIWGPHGTMVRVDGNKVEFNPLDPPARQRAYEEALRTGNNKVSIKLGAATMKTTSIYTAMNPSTSPKLRAAAMDFYIKFRFGGMEVPLKQGDLTKSSFSLKTSAAELKAYIDKHKKLPKGFKFPNNRCFKPENIEINDFVLFDSELRLMDQIEDVYEVIKEARVKIINELKSGLEHEIKGKSEAEIQVIIEAKMAELNTDAYKDASISIEEIMPSSLKVATNEAAEKAQEGLNEVARSIAMKSR